MKDYKDVLFDFDGILGTTMEDNFRARTHAINQHGTSIEKQEYFKSEGLPTKELAIRFLRRNGMDSDLVSHIVEEKEKHYMRHQVFELYPGVERLIDVLKENEYLFGMVSGGS